MLPACKLLPTDQQPPPTACPSCSLHLVCGQRSACGRAGAVHCARAHRGQEPPAGHRRGGECLLLACLPAACCWAACLGLPEGCQASACWCGLLPGGFGAAARWHWQGWRTARCQRRPFPPGAPFNASHCLLVYFSPLPCCRSSAPSPGKQLPLPCFLASSLARPLGSMAAGSAPRCLQSPQTAHATSLYLRRMLTPVYNKQRPCNSAQ